jgi:hypothetical protein
VRVRARRLCHVVRQVLVAARRGQARVGRGGEVVRERTGIVIEPVVSMARRIRGAGLDAIEDVPVHHDDVASQIGLAACGTGIGAGEHAPGQIDEAVQRAGGFHLIGLVDDDGVVRHGAPVPGIVERQGVGVRSGIDPQHLSAREEDEAELVVVPVPAPVRTVVERQVVRILRRSAAQDGEAAGVEDEALTHSPDFVGEGLDAPEERLFVALLPQQRQREGRLGVRSVRRLQTPARGPAQVHLAGIVERRKHQVARREEHRRRVHALQPRIRVGGEEHPRRGSAGPGVRRVLAPFFAPRGAGDDQEDHFVVHVGALAPHRLGNRHRHGREARARCRQVDMRVPPSRRMMVTTPRARRNPSITGITTTGSRWQASNEAMLYVEP